MTVCLDTNVFLQIFGRRQPYHQLVTDDAHFAVLKTAGYKPQPISPEEFIRVHLAGA